MSDKDNRDRQPDAPAPFGGGLSLLWLAGFAILAMLMMLPTGPTSQTVPYSQIKQMIGAGKIATATLEEHAITVTERAASDGATADGGPKRLRAVTPSQGDPELLPLLEKQNVTVTATEPAQTSFLAYLLPWLLMASRSTWCWRA